jgi:membrane protein
MAADKSTLNNPTTPHSPPHSPTHLHRRGSWAALKRAVRQFKHHDITDRAAALTYFGVLALFPGLLVLVSILGLVGRSTTQKVLDNVGQIAPGGVRTFLKAVIDQVQGKQGAASVAAIVGILLAIWSASGYVAAFMRAMNAIYGVDEGRPVWRTAPIRLAITVATLILLVISALMVVLTGRIASQVGQAVGLGHVAVRVWDIAKWPVLLLLVTVMLSLLYWASPNVKQVGPRWITPGGIIAVVVWLIASGAFAVYVAFSGSYNKTYGSLATVIIFLVWLWITNIAILLGAEVNAELQHQRMIEAGLPEHIQPFAEPRDTRKLSEDEQLRVRSAAAERSKALRHRRR